MSDPFQHELIFERRCDLTITPDSLRYAENVTGDARFTFFTSCKNVNGTNLHVYVTEEDGTKSRMKYHWSHLEGGTEINATKGITVDQAGKTYVVNYWWEGSNNSKTFKFTVSSNWGNANIADQFATFTVRLDDGGNVFGKLGEMSATCADYGYEFRIEPINPQGEGIIGRIFDIKAENKWARNLPNGDYEVWFYSADAPNGEICWSDTDTKFTVKRAEVPAETLIQVPAETLINVAVDPIITLPRIDNTNKNDAVKVESQVTTINCALNCYDDLISLTGQTEGELYVQVVEPDGELSWMQFDRSKSVNQIPINEMTQELKVRVFDKKANTYVDGSLGLNRTQSANTTNVATSNSNSSNSTRNIMIICGVVLCAYFVKTRGSKQRT